MIPPKWLLSMSSFAEKSPLMRRRDTWIVEGGKWERSSDSSIEYPL